VSEKKGGGRRGEADELTAIFELWRKDVVGFVKDLSYAIDMVGVSAVLGLGMAVLIVLSMTFLAYPFYTMDQTRWLLFVLILGLSAFYVYRSLRLLGKYRLLKRKYEPLARRTHAIESG
jgi:hypothetical protein